MILKIKLEYKKNLPLLILFLVVSLSTLSSNIIAPSLNSISKDYNLLTSMSSMIMTSFFFSYAFGQILAGQFSDRFGRKIVLIIGLGIYIISCLLCGLSMSFVQLLIFRSIQGFGTGIGVNIYNSAIYDIYKGNKAGKVFSYISSLLAFVSVLAPLIGDFFEVNYNWHYSFFFLFIVGILIFLLSITKFKETNTSIQKNESINKIVFIKNFSKDYINISKKLFKSSLFLFNTFSLTLTYTTLLLLISTLPGIIKNSLPAFINDISELYIFMVLGYMTGNIINGKLIGTLSDFKNYLLGYASIILPSVFLLLSPFVINFWTLVFCLYILNFGIGLLFPKFMSTIVRSFPEYRGSASALAGFIQCVTSSLFVSFIALNMSASINIFIIIIGITTLSFIYFFSNKTLKLNLEKLNIEHEK